MVEDASQLMFSATGIMAYFGDVVIVVPKSWPCPGITFESMQLAHSWDSSHLRVGPSHYLFGDNPWTQQPGGCGEPGDFIYLPENFLLTNTDVGSPGEDTEAKFWKLRGHLFQEGLLNFSNKIAYLIKAI